MTAALLDSSKWYGNLESIKLDVKKELVLKGESILTKYVNNKADTSNYDECINVLNKALMLSELKFSLLHNSLRSWDDGLNRLKKVFKSDINPDTAYRIAKGLKDEFSNKKKSIISEDNNIISCDCSYSGSFYETESSLTCPNCGLEQAVKNYNVDKEEKRYYDSEEAKNRKRTHVTPKYETTCRTFVPHLSVDSNGRQLSCENKILAYRLRKSQSRFGGPDGKHESHLKTLFKSGAVQFINAHFPKIVVDTALNIYKEAASRKSCKGRSTQLLLATCLYDAMKINSEPFLLSFLVNSLPKNWYIKKGRIQRLESIIKSKGVFEELGYNIKKKNLIPWLDIQNRVNDECGSEVLNHKSVLLLSKIYNEVLKNEPLANSKSVLSVLAAEIYSINPVLNVKLNQEFIANALGITEVSLRNISKILKTINYTEKIRDYLAYYNKENNNN